MLGATGAFRVLEPDNLNDLGHLLGTDRLKGLAQTELGPVIIRDRDRRILWASEHYEDPCLKAQSRFGQTCSGCYREQIPLRILNCELGLRRGEAEIRIAGELAGWVAGPDQRTKKYLKRVAQVKPTRMMKRRQVRPETWLPVVASVARVIQLEAEIERGNRIRLQADRKLRDLRSTGDAVEVVFDSMHRLFGQVDIIFYRRLDTGVLIRHTVSGQHKELMPTEISDREGHVGWVAEHREPYYEPNLIRPNLNGPRFVQPSREAPYCSAVTFPVFIPNPRQWDMTMGVLQLCSFQPEAFPVHLHSVAQSIIASANLHAARARWSETAIRHVQARSNGLAPDLAPWRQELIEILQDALNDRGKALACKRRLCRAVAKHACLISGARNSSLRWRKGAGMEFLACAGHGWTEKEKKETYSKDDNSTGIYVLKTGQVAYIEDTKAPKLKLPYREIFEETRSLIVLPVRVRGLVQGVLSADSIVTSGFSPPVRDALASLRREFESALDALMVIEHSLIRSLEHTLLQAGDLSRFAFEASRLIGRMFGSQVCSLFTLKGDAVALEGTTSEVRGAERIKFVDEMGSELTREVAADGMPYRGRTSAGPPGLAVPIKIRQKVRGVICVIGKKPTAKEEGQVIGFTIEDEAFLIQIASWLEEMLLTFFVTQEAEVQARHAAKEVVQAQQLLLAEGLDSLGQALANLVLAETGSIGVHFRLADKDENMRLYGAAGIFRQVLTPVRPKGQGVSSWVQSQGEPLWASRVQGEHHWQDSLEGLRTLLKLEPTVWIRSSCGLPMIVHGKTIGALVVHWRDEQKFGPNQQSQLKDLADRSGRLFHRILIQNETAERLTRQVSTLVELRELSAEFVKTIDLDRLLDGILTMAREKTGMEIGTIRLRNPESGKLELRAPQKPSEGQLLEVTESDFIKRGMSALEPTHFHDVQTDPTWLDMMRSLSNPGHRAYLEKFRSLVQVPIRLNSEPVGLISLHAMLPRTLDGNTLALLPILADYAAVAIEMHQLKRQLDNIVPLAEVSEVVADMVHVVRNDINAIQTIIATIRDEDLKAADTIESMNRLRIRVSGLIKACHTIIQESSETPMPSRVDVNQSVRDVIQDFADTTLFKRVKYSPELTPELTVYGCENHIRGVVRHIVRNALEAMPLGGRLAIRTQKGEDAESTVIEIEDGGPGMSHEVRERCTRPFYTTKQGSGGSGLGLWISVQMLKRIKGHLEIKTELGQGTTMRIVLPGGEQ